MKTLQGHFDEVVVINAPEMLTLISEEGRIFFVLRQRRSDTDSALL